MNKLQWKQLYREQRLARKEVWKPIIWYEGIYEVSNNGKVKVLNHRKFFWERLLKSSTKTGWYRTVALSIWWESKNKLLHRLVAQAFIPNLDNKPYINHKNGITHDNSLENLEWCTHKENMIHSFKNLWRIWWFTWFRWALSIRSKRIEQYDLSMNKIAEYESVREATRKLWFPQSNISACARWKYKTSNGFIWKYI